MSTGNLAGSTIHEQTRQALTNCRAVLHAAGATLEDVVEVGVLLANPTDFAGMKDEYATWFPAEPPTRYVAKLGVEIPGGPRLDSHDRVPRLADGVLILI